MAKIAFMGAGSTIFAKSVLGDSMLTESLRDAHIALYDIDRERLSESKMMLRHFGYYNTESSEHTAEYHPYFIKSTSLELINELNIPLDEYLRRCVNQIEEWKNRGKELTLNPNLTHTRSELTLDEIRSMCNDLIKAHGSMLPSYK